jgi:putative phosphoribosyl transferase
MMQNLSAFADRAEAAEALALRLQDYQGRHPLILAIPRGAVPMGKIIAERLKGELDVVLVHKLRSLFNPEFAIGSIDESGWTYINPFAEEESQTNGFMAMEKSRQLEILKQRRAQYTPSRQPLDPSARIAIVVDDGLATGATMIAALHAVRAKNPAELVCAIPVAAPDSLARVTPFADKVVCLHAPRNFAAVSQFYRHFRQVDDEEVCSILRGADARQKTRSNSR